MSGADIARFLGGALIIPIGALAALIVLARRDRNRHPLDIDLLDYVEGKAGLRAMEIAGHLDTCHRCAIKDQRLRDFVARGSAS